MDALWFDFVDLFEFSFFGVVRVVVRCLDERMDTFFCWAVVSVGPRDAGEWFDQFLFGWGEAVESADAFGAFSCLAVDIIPCTGEVDVALGTLDEAFGGSGGGIDCVVVHM